MTSLFQILLMILDIAKWIILAHIIMSWLINFQPAAPCASAAWGAEGPLTQRMRSTGAATSSVKSVGP